MLHVKTHKHNKHIKWGDILFWMNPIDKVVKPKYHLNPDLYECVEAMLRSDLWRK